METFEGLGSVRTEPAPSRMIANCEQTKRYLRKYQK